MERYHRKSNLNLNFIAFFCCYFNIFLIQKTQTLWLKRYANHYTTNNIGNENEIHLMKLKEDVTKIYTKKYAKEFNQIRKYLRIKYYKAKIYIETLLSKLKLSYRIFKEIKSLSI